VSSIRRDLLAWLLSSVLAGGLAASAVVFFQARAEVNELFDYQLRQLALTLRDRSYSPGALAEALQGRGREAPEWEDALDFVIEVWAPDGTPLYISHPRLRVPGAVQLGLSEVDAPDGSWRVFAIQQRGLTIQVAQPMAVRRSLAFSTAGRTLLPFLLALPLMGFLIWRLVGRALAPLESTARAVAKRTPQSLAPVRASDVPEEVLPLVEALNGLLARLDAALGQQRQFIADAAHELRTPLTALRLQLQLAERAQDEAARRSAYAALREGILRATHLVGQLLALARQDPDAPIATAVAIDLSVLAAQVAEAHIAAAEDRGLALHVEAPEPVPLRGDPAALRTLADNLVDNALRYTTSGRVIVRARHEAGTAVFEVEDTGPGIPEAERERVFDRFYRGEGAASGGSGLGLAIARRIAERHGGGISLAAGAGGQGLLARVVLPARNALPP
jgi:two-component system OmpR family sensor kinase